MPAPKPTEAAVARAVNGVRKAGLEVMGVEFHPGGIFRVLAWQPHHDIPSTENEVDEWDRASGPRYIVEPLAGL